MAGDDVPKEEEPVPAMQEEAKGDDPTSQDAEAGKGASKRKPRTRKNDRVEGAGDEDQKVDGDRPAKKNNKRKERAERPGQNRGKVWQVKESGDNMDSNAKGEGDFQEPDAGLDEEGKIEGDGENLAETMLEAVLDADSTTDQPST